MKTRIHLFRAISRTKTPPFHPSLASLALDAPSRIDRSTLLCSTTFSARPIMMRTDWAHLPVLKGTPNQFGELLLLKRINGALEKHRLATAASHCSFLLAAKMIPKRERGMIKCSLFHSMGRTNRDTSIPMASSLHAQSLSESTLKSPGS